MIFSKSRPVKIVLVGTGGTGEMCIRDSIYLFDARNLNRPPLLNKSKICALHLPRAKNWNGTLRDSSKTIFIFDYACL